MEDYNVIINDFNKIASFGNDPKWNHNNCYFGHLLKYIPHKTDFCLDIGCGKGELSYLAAQKAKKVLAVDIADEMIAYAAEHYAAENIEYRCGNVLGMDFEDDSLDVIITTATAHHLPYEWLLNFSKNKLKTGGRLIVLDLVEAATISDKLLWGFAFFPNILMNILKNGRLHKDEPHVAEFWREHGKRDEYMTMKEIRQLAARHLPGAKIRRKLFWRYSLIWEKTINK